MQRSAPQPASRHVVDPRLTHYLIWRDSLAGLTKEDGFFQVSAGPSYEPAKVNFVLTGNKAAWRAIAAALQLGRPAYSSSSNGTMVDFTVFMAMAWATASLTPATVKGNSVCILRQGYLSRAL